MPETCVYQQMAPNVSLPLGEMTQNLGEMLHTKQSKIADLNTSVHRPFLATVDLKLPR